METGKSDWVQVAQRALAAGELLAAFDAADKGLGSTNPSMHLRYLQILSLARMGDLDRAQRLYDAHLAGTTSDIDILALGARLMKDRAWQARDEERIRLVRAASVAYAAIYDRTGDVYPGINAASLAYLAGEHDVAVHLAASVADAVTRRRSSSYYDAVTFAEAQLLLGCETEALATVETALASPDIDSGARSTTCRQFVKLTEAGLPGAALVKKLRPPPVLTYCGHMFTTGPDEADVLLPAVRKALAKIGPHYAYGALACGADILIAEALLARGSDLHVVLPFRIEDFIRTSVAIGGGTWVARFHRCLEQAQEVVIASEASAMSDDRQLEYGSMLSMGYARLRADHLCTSAIQLAVWDGRPSAGPAGTGSDVDRWRRHGSETAIVPIDRTAYPPPPAAMPSTKMIDREVRAMIFTDFAGFSKIDERDLPEFWRVVMGTAARIVARHRPHIHATNTWGDALYIVTENARSAAAIALDLQAELMTCGLDRFGTDAGMRVSAHIGAVYKTADPVTGQTTFFGHEVNKTARIEPITLVGEVYATRAFAAILEMEARHVFDLSYVGQIALAKAFGTTTIYRLGRRRG